MSWGMVYVLSEKVIKAGLSPVAFQLFLGVVSLPFYAILFAVAKNKKADIDLIFSNAGLLWSTIGAGFLIVLANLLILFAVQDKNATLVSLLEITYPIFTLAFAVWILGDVQLNMATFVGATLIVMGVGVVLLKG